MLDEDLIKGAKGVEVYTRGLITERQAFRLASEGKIPVIRLGRAMYFRKSELEAVFRSTHSAHSAVGELNGHSTVHGHD